MKAKEVVLIIVLILAGMAVYAAREGRFEFNWSENGFRFGFYEEYEFEETQTIEPPLPAKLKLVNRQGSIDVQGTDEDKLRFTLQKRIWRKTKKKADEVAAKLKAVVERDGDILSLSTNRGVFRKTGFQTNFKVWIPRRMAVELDNTHGDVLVTEAAETSVTNSHGDVSVSDIAGGLFIKNNHGLVEADRVEAGCRLETAHDDLKVSGIKGDAVLSNRHGRVRLRDISGQTEIEAPFCVVEGSHLAGLLKIANSHEKIILDAVGGVQIVSRHSPVEIHEVQGDVAIEDTYAQVELQAIRGRVLVSGKSLEVSARAIAGDEIRIKTTHENVTLEDFSAPTYIQIEHGNTQLAPSSLSHPIEVLGRYGDIVLAWPAGETNPLEASTRGGDVDWGLSARPDVEETNGTSVLKAFLKETGKPAVRLTTSHGHIRIREGSNR